MTATTTNGISQELRDQIQAAIVAQPNRMTMQLAREFGVPEAEVVRAMPAGRAVELDMGRWEELIRSLEGLGTCHVIVSNRGATLEAVGTFGGFSTWEEFFNVQTDTLDMHIRWPNLGAAFAVEKPSHMSDINTYSLQFFDKAGHAAFKAFLNFGGKLQPERRAAFSLLRDQFKQS